MFELSRGEASFCGDSEEFVAVNRMGIYCFLIFICYVGICRIKNYLMSEGNLVAWPGQFFFFTIKRTRGRFKFERTCTSPYGYPVFEMGEYAGMLPRKFISFHCLENEYNEQKESNTEGTENFLDLHQRSESDAKGSEGGESPEKRLVDLEVMPVCEIREESAEVVVVPNLTNVVESVQEDTRDDSHIVVSHLLGESLEVLDDSQLQRLMENSPGESTMVLEEERIATFRGVGAGQCTENVTFFDDVVNLESENRTSAPSKDAARVGGKRKAVGSEVKLGSVFHQKIVAFEIGDGSDEDCMGLQREIEKVNAGKSCLSSDCADRTLTEFGLSELEMMARAKAQDLGPDSHVVSSDGMVRVPTVGSSGGPPDVGAVRTKYYPSQSAKTLLKDFF